MSKVYEIAYDFKRDGTVYHKCVYALGYTIKDVKEMFIDWNDCFYGIHPFHIRVVQSCHPALNEYKKRYEFKTKIYPDYEVTLIYAVHKYCEEEEGFFTAVE